MKRRIGITMGDPAGIGPEIIVKALAKLAETPDPELELVVVGTGHCLAAAAELVGAGRVVPAGTGRGWPDVAVVEAATAEAPIRFGETSAEAGRLAYHAIRRAVELAMAGEIDAIVTPPISKEAINLAGFAYSGHTDMLADLTRSRDSCMMLAHGGLRVSHVSTHVALSRVPALVTAPRLRRVIELTAEAVRDLGVAEPTIAVAALNPHAGENGLFGVEDTEIVLPVLRELDGRGQTLVGPVPGDTIFVKALAGHYDAVVAMYHDQGHIPVKLLGFKIDPDTGKWVGLSGVNITLGLPIVRTSVDHGTAFDIAGTGIANEQSLIEAIEYAQRLSAARRRRG